MRRGITMHRQLMRALTLTALPLAVVTLLWNPVMSLAGEKALDTATIERLSGVKGELSEQEGVLKVSVPRTDLDISVAGVKMTPPTR
jgi:hypothetical protein